jgi:catechol 2,3-dioxygenase-like lactoylglutathione lyase family enzyme
MYQLSLVSLAVADQERARAFYVEKLGCVVQREHEAGDGRRWMILRLPAGVTRIVLVHPSAAMPAGSTKGLILKTVDIDSARRRLIERGLAIGDVREIAWGRYAAFTDPDGKGWMLAEALDGL